MLKKIQIFLFVSLFVSACTINEPKLPSWETEWNIYLPTEDFIMVDAINDTSLVADTTESGIPIVSLAFSDSTDREYIGAEDLALEPQAEHHKATLDEIKLNKPKSITTDSISVINVLPEEFMNGDTLPPYPQITVSSPDDIPIGQAEFTHYEVVEVNTGNMYITFHNNMFLRIRTGMQIEIYDDSLTSHLIGTATFAEIPPYSSVDSDDIDLAGKRIKNKLFLKYSIPIAGSDTLKVLTEQDKNGSFYNEITMSELQVAYAKAKIPTQTFTSKDSIDLTEEDHRIIEATIDKGHVFLHIKNNLPIRAETKVTLPDIRKDNQPKVITVPLESQDTTTIKVDLSGWELINFDKPPEEYIDYIDFYSATTVDSTEGFEELAGDDSVSIDVTSDSLFFSYVKGDLDKIDVDIDPVEISNFDFFEDIEGEAKLEDLVMTLNFENEINFPIHADLRIGGYHYDKTLNQITDSVIIFINDLLIKEKDITTEVFDADATTPSIVDLIAIFPTEIKISGSAYIEGEGSAYLDDGLQVFYNIESPLSIDITEPISFEAEVERLDDLDKDMREILSDDMTKCCVKFDFRNTLPIEANIKYYIAEDSLELYSDAIPDPSEKIIIDKSIAAGNVGASGYVGTEERSTIEISLSEEQLDIFKNDTLYTRQVIEIPVTNGTVRIRQADGIKIEGNVNFKVFINKD